MRQLSSNKFNFPAWLLSASLTFCSGQLFAEPATVDSTDETQTASADASSDENSRLAVKELRAFVNAFSTIRNAYVEEVDDKTLLEYAIKGMLSELDPHSNYLEPKTFDELQVNATGTFGGLGMEVGMEDGFVKVVAPIDDTPAQRAGIESGDLIIKIDNKPVKGLSLNEAIELMRGEVNTQVEITVVRTGVAQPIDYTLTRDTISVVSVRSRFIEDDYLYLRIAQFQGNTGEDLRKAIDKASKKNTPKGIVLDLRNNPGGVLQAAADVVDSFIDQGLIVYTEGRVKDNVLKFEATDDGNTITTPMVVLINGGSASASEIVAGALQDHKRAIVLGTTSFGKGSVQTVLPLSETHFMKLTTARYFTPLGRSIQAQGIEPDIIVERGRITQEKNKHRVKEADLHGHLGNQGSEAGESSNATSDKDRLLNDSQLHEAITLLKGINILSSTNAIGTRNKNLALIEKNTQRLDKRSNDLLVEETISQQTRQHAH